MWKKFTALFNNNPTATPGTEEDCLALKQQVQSLELELLEREQTIAGLKSSLEKLRTGENSLASEKAKAQIENMMADASAPASQLLTLAHLSEIEGKTVQIRDVITVTRRLIRVLENHGMETGAEVGEIVAFDPDRHQPLDQEVGFKPGEPVQIRFSSIAYQGKLLRKAGVSAAPKISASEVA
jgi:molecular chaperone GrpE (heat shock protein)